MVCQQSMPWNFYLVLAMVCQQFSWKGFSANKLYRIHRLAIPAYFYFNQWKLAYKLTIATHFLSDQCVSSKTIMYKKEYASNNGDKTLYGTQRTFSQLLAPDGYKKPMTLVVHVVTNKHNKHICSGRISILEFLYAYKLIKCYKVAFFRASMTCAFMLYQYS